MSESTTARKIEVVALGILEEEGPEAVSMRRIAKAVGVTPMALYHHFLNRDAILRATTDREFERLADYLQTAEDAGSAETQLLKVMDSYLDYAFTRPRLFDYVFSQHRSDARRFPEDFRDRRSPTMNRIADIVTQAMNTGEFRKDDVWEVALELWANVHGYLALFRSGRIALTEDDFRNLCRRSLGRLFDGIKS